MNRFILFITFLIFVNQNNLVLAQEEKAEEQKSSISLVLNQDPVFGFYPSAYGYIPIKENLSFTFYGVYWAYGSTTPETEGISVIGEFGAGVNFSLFNGLLSINPAIGIGSGRYQSGASRPVVMDNLVLNLNLALAKDNFSASGGLIFWLASRKEGPSQLNVYDYFLSAGYSISKNIEAGIYFEDLINQSKTDVDGKVEKTTTTGYLWLGPYLKFKVTSGAYLTSMVGYDLADYANNVPKAERKLKEFYKLSLGFEL